MLPLSLHLARNNPKRQQATALEKELRVSEAQEVQPPKRKENRTFACKRAATSQCTDVLLDDGATDKSLVGCKQIECLLRIKVGSGGSRRDLRFGVYLDGFNALATTQCLTDTRRTTDSRHTGDVELDNRRKLS